MVVEHLTAFARLENRIVGIIDHAALVARHIDVKHTGKLLNLAAHALQFVVAVHVHRTVFVFHVHNQCINDVHVHKEAVVIEMAVVGHEIEQTADDAAGKEHVAVLFDRNQLVHGIDIDNLRVTEHEELTAGDFQVVGKQIQGSIVCLRLQLDVVIIFLFQLIIKVLRNLTTIVDAVVIDVIFDKTSGGEVNHHRLDIQWRFVEPTDDIFDSKILITSTVE